MILEPVVSDGQLRCLALYLICRYSETGFGIDLCAAYMRFGVGKGSGEREGWVGGLGGAQFLE